MEISASARSVRRLDRIVAVLKGLWNVGWLIDGIVIRANGSVSLPWLFGIAFILLSTASIELPFVFGVAMGRRWGFIGLAVFSGMGWIGSLTIPLMGGRWLTALDAATALVNALLFTYCLFRLRQDRVPEGGAPRSPAMRFGDALTGALGAVWALSAVALIGPSLLRHPMRPFDSGIGAMLGLLSLFYLAACAGVGFGWRWGFVAMIVASVFTLVVLVRDLLLLPSPPPQMVVVAVYSAAAIVYCGLRLRRPRIRTQSRQSS